MPIIYLFNEGISINKDITIENLFTTIANDTFDPELWDEHILEIQNLAIKSIIRFDISIFN